MSSTPSPDQLRALIRRVAVLVDDSLLAREILLVLTHYLSVLEPLEAPRTGEGEQAVNDYEVRGIVYCGKHRRPLDATSSCSWCSAEWEKRPRTQGAEG